MSGLSKLNLKKKIQMLSKKTHFTETEVGKLLDCHFQIMVGIILSYDICENIKLFLQKSDNFRSKVDRKKFRQFLHDNFNMTDDVIIDRIFKYFNKVSTDDIDTEEWVLGFNVFLKGKMLLVALKLRGKFKDLMRN